MAEEAPLTILFTDVEGSTDLRTQVGDSAAHAILRAHEELVRGCVAAHGGREVKALGDGLMIAFTSARRGLACAVAIQQATEEQRRRSTGAAKDAPPGAAGDECTPVVDRKAELGELRLLLDQAVRGSGGLVMVGGEPGVSPPLAK